MPLKFQAQYDAMDCGPACLTMICSFHGKHYSPHVIREKTQIGKEGVNMMGISDAAESLGFHTLAAQLTYEQLTEEASLPCILHWNQDHFVVLLKVKKRFFSTWRRNTDHTLVIADPAVGIREVSSQDFKKCWFSSKLDGEYSGIALMLQPTEEFFATNSANENKGTNLLAFKRIFNYILPYKKLVFQLLMGLGLASLFQLLLPFLTQRVVDVGIQTKNIHFIYILLAAQLSLFTGRLIVDFIQGWILLHISTRINVSILTDFLIKLMKLPLRFFDSKKTGDILQRMNDHQRIENFLTGSALNIVFAIVNLVVFLIVLATFNSSILYIFLVASVAYTIWVLLFLSKRKQLDYKRFDISSQEQSSSIQMIQGMQEIKLQGCERTIRWRWEKLQARLFKLNVSVLALEQWQKAGAFFIHEGKNILITFISAKAVIDGDMTLGTMMAVQYIIGQLNSPIEQMIQFVQHWQDARISIDRLNEIHNLEDEEPVHINYLRQLSPVFSKAITGGKLQQPLPFTTAQSIQHTPAASGASIHFENVTFTYPGAGNEPVLRDISLTIPEGKTTAIVGVSGSGKTTLLKMLLKFYTPVSGEIKLGMLSLESISSRAWRKHCGVVMQDSFIFSDTIAGNIAVGVEKVDRKRLEHAAQIANIMGFIDSLPLGFHTKIGAEGEGTSMGQRQRILIARAVYKNPDIILLDEATNSLDANNETTITQNLQKAFEGKTVIVVAHRLSTVKNADQIVVLNKGVITEKGTHQELVNLKGEYFTLVKNQLELGN